MKHFTLTLALIAFVATAAMAQKPLFRHAMHTASKSIVIKQDQRKTPLLKTKKAANSTNIRPQHEETFYYEDEEWLADGTYDYTYDKVGNIVKAIEAFEDGATQTIYEYNENGMETSKTTTTDDGSGNFENTSLLTKEYDSKVPSLVTSSLEYAWNETGWQMISAGRTWKRDVSRDNNGNVTGVSLSVYYQGVFDECYRSTLTYGDDGKAATWKYEELMYDEESASLTWQAVYSMKDIVWNNTNGQIVNFEMEDFFSGDNRIASATVIDEEEAIEYHVSAAYEDNGCYSYTVTSDNPVTKGTFSYTITDENGSYIQQAESQEDTNYDGIIDYQDETYTEKMEATYDGHGNIVFEGSYEDDEIASALKYEYTYGEADTDYPSEQIHYEYDPDTDEYVPFIKVVSSDFIDVRNSIRSINTSSTDATSVYNLQGMRLADVADQLPAGIYIVRNGQQTHKIVKR